VVLLVPDFVEEILSEPAATLDPLRELAGRSPTTMVRIALTSTEIA